MELLHLLHRPLLTVRRPDPEDRWCLRPAEASVVSHQAVIPIYVFVTDMLDVLAAAKTQIVRRKMHGVPELARPYLAEH